MESSTVIAFRALVMLACLIIVPLAAIFGSQFPDVVKSVLIDRFWPANGKPISSEQAQRPEAPPFSTAAAPAWRSDGAPAAGSPATSFGGSATQPMASPPSGIEPTAAWGSGESHVRQAGAELAVNPPGAVQRIDGTAVAYPAANTHPGNTNSTSPPQVISQPDRFTWMERRLRDYGATYYLLETWVHDGERYRFICQMALANNPGHTRKFEATDTDPLRAMGRVLEQVEAWRAGRAP